MIIYQGTRQDFHDACNYGRIAECIKNGFRKFRLSGGSEGEVRAWESSLPVVDSVLEIAKVPNDISVSIELQIPLTAKRIDFLISGYDESGSNNVVIVELKQWSDCEPTSFPGIVNTFVGQANRNVAHPSYQAWSYAATIENFNEAYEKKELSLYPCAFLHNFPNANRFKLDGSLYREYIDEAPLFLKDDRVKLASFISKFIQKSDRGRAIFGIENGKIRPSKALQDTLGSMLRGNREFVLLDDQKVAFERILALTREAIRDQKKRTILVQGGPGTGKSVVAINLLVAAIREGLTAAYVTKNGAPRYVYFEQLRKEKVKASYVRNLFLGSGKFVDSPRNSYNLLICDEAHRLNAKSGMYQNLGENQVKEIINASLVNVFFLDEDQIVTTKDIGSREEIRKWAEEERSELISGKDFVLSSQFRCNGSDAYLAFVDNLLAIRSTAHPTLEGLDFDFRVYDGLCAMRDDLRKLNGNNKARMLAGYCYDWVSKKVPSAYDINIGNFHAQWNFNSTNTWAIDPDSFEQVGCIHTCQGIEFDHVGVIIGKDLLFRDGHVVTDYRVRARTDQSLKGIKSMADKSIADRIIRDTYKVLLTRGQKSCWVYIEDPALREHVKSLLSQQTFENRD